MALIWDLMALPKSIDEPILVYVRRSLLTVNNCNKLSRYNAPAPVNQLQWSKAHTDWVAIAYAPRRTSSRIEIM